jgi:hypothetical protein
METPNVVSRDHWFKALRRQHHALTRWRMAMPCEHLGKLHFSGTLSA